MRRLKGDSNDIPITPPPLPPGLSLIASFSFFSLSKVVSGDHGFELHPAAPEREPAGEAVAFAILMSAQARHMHVERFDRDDAPQPTGIVPGEHLRGGASGGARAASRSCSDRRASPNSSPPKCRSPHVIVDSPSMTSPFRMTAGQPRSAHESIGAEVNCRRRFPTRLKQLPTLTRADSAEHAALKERPSKTTTPDTIAEQESVRKDAGKRKAIGCNPVGINTF